MLLSAIIFFIFIVPTFVFAVFRTEWNRLFMPLRNLYQRLFPVRPHSDSRNHVENVEPVETYNPEGCPICLNSHELTVETNCGHLYCGNCLRMYIYMQSIMTPVSCPMCRQPVTILFPCFALHELEASPTSTIGGEVGLLHSMVENYNRRFSGASRSLMEMICDMPVLLRHLWNEFFSNHQMMMIRIRIVMYFKADFMILFSSLGIIPEAVFEVIDFLEGILLIFGLVVYIRHLVRTRGVRND